MPLCRFTGAQDRATIGLSPNLVMLVGKGSGGLVTQIQTGIMTPKGPISLEVLETVEEVCDIVDRANGVETLTAAKPSGVVAS